MNKRASELTSKRSWSPHLFSRNADK